MTDLHTELNTKLTVLKQENKILQTDMETLKKSFSKKYQEDQNINIYANVANQNNISMYTSTNGCTQLRLNIKVFIKLNKVEKTYFLEEDYHNNSQSMNSQLDFYKKSFDAFETINKEDFISFLQQFNKMNNKHKSNYKKIEKLQKEILEEENRDNLRCLSTLFFNSDKEAIKEEKRLFSEEETYSKEMVFLEICTNNKLEFRKTNLSVSNDNKKLFFLNSSLISKKYAMDIIEKQVYLNKIQITKLEQLPHYSGRYSCSFNVDLHSYIKLVKPLSISKKIINF
jgi:hypothetical protein